MSNLIVVDGDAFCRVAIIVDNIVVAIDTRSLAAEDRIPSPTAQVGDIWNPESNTFTPGAPQSCTPAQGLMALYELKQITEDDISEAINGIADTTLRYQATIAFKKATVWERASTTMQTLAALLGLTEADLDELFALAATYTNL